MSMERTLQELPIGIHSFESIRQRNYLYVDKTAKLQRLIESGERYFLSRPRRFGKSLTLSTIEAMFSGRKELFKGLAAEEWVTEQAKHPAPVLWLDMSSFGKPSSSMELNNAIVSELEDFASDHGLALMSENFEEKNEENTGCARTLRRVIRALYKDEGYVVVLIDEYDEPMLDSIGDLKKANSMREVLRSFYTVLKSCDKYLRFVMLTGISKFSKTGVFSAMNNLMDISMDWRYGDIVGYTQNELEKNLSDWIDGASKRMKMSYRELLNRLRDYYDGFCFDGEIKLYNPFSIMQCLAKCEISNYWYDSGSPSFVVNYMKQHAIKSPEEYRHIEVTSDFVSSQEIERARAESFLYQSGYLTIERKEEQALILDYPNREVLDSLSRMYLEHVYHVESYGALGSQIWKALKTHDIVKVVELYNIALSGIPYDDYKDQGEIWYRSLFLMLLRGAGITANGEAHTNKGRPDVIAQFPEQVIVLEFKYAKDSSEVDSKRVEGETQIQEKNYARPYEGENRAITTAVIVIDGDKRNAVL